MARTANQKSKLLYVLRILREQTDPEHPISMNDLIGRLEDFGIAAERKSLYRDIAELTDFGYDIRRRGQRAGGGYYLASREFELAELKLLVDAVQASRFLSLKQSRTLIAKLEAFASRHEASQLQRQVYVANRVKTGNESMYATVDLVHRAIQQNVKISFRYFTWTVQKQMQFRHGGARYQVSPYALTVKDENYYMAAYDSEAGMLKHYRVDKMTEPRLEEAPREGAQLYAGMDIAAYANKTFGMFGGEEETVTIVCADRLIGVIMDRFGADVPVRALDGGRFQIRVPVVVSGQFFGWLTGLGKEAALTAPARVAEEYRAYLRELLER